MYKSPMVDKLDEQSSTCFSGATTLYLVYEQLWKGDASETRADVRRMVVGPFLQALQGGRAGVLYELCYSRGYKGMFAAASAVSSLDVRKTLFSGCASVTGGCIHFAGFEIGLQ